MGTISLFQLYTTEDIFSGVGCSYVRCNNFVFGKICIASDNAVKQSVIPKEPNYDCMLSGKSFVYNKKSKEPRTVPWGMPEVTEH